LNNGTLPTTGSPEHIGSAVHHDSYRDRGQFSFIEVYLEDLAVNEVTEDNLFLL
jgi:hypothetical protein